MPRFCVNCGIDEGGGIPIINNLCLKCYVKLREVVKVPNSIEIRMCGRCGALLIEGRWCYPINAEESLNMVKKVIEFSIEPGEDVLVRNVNIELPPPNFAKAHVHIELLIKSKYDYVSEYDINIKWIKQLCPICFKRVGRSFDAVVQLRFTHLDENAKKFRENIVKIFQDYIVEVDEVDNGFDIKVASPSIARKIADIVKNTWRVVKVIESYGDVKRARNGSKQAKLYISVKVLNLWVGDYIIVDGKAYTVVEVNDKAITVVDSVGAKKSIDVEKLLSHYERSRSKHKQRSYAYY